MPSDARPFRLIHVSDIHVWQYAFNPLQLFSKRLLGMALAPGPAGAQVPAGAACSRSSNRVLSLEPDHILITGDLTTTALPAEFRAARKALAPWLTTRRERRSSPATTTDTRPVATGPACSSRSFGEFAPAADVSLAPVPGRPDGDPGPGPYPGQPHRPGTAARAATRTGARTARRTGARIRRLIVACHYPLDAPAAHRRDLARKRMINAEELARLAGDARPSPLLLRPRPRGLGVRPPSAFPGSSA